MLTGPRPRRAFEQLDASGLLDQCLPEVAAMRGVSQPPEYHPEGDVWRHTLLLLGHLRAPSPRLAWAALLHDLGKPPVRQPEGVWPRFPCHDRAGEELARQVLVRLRASRGLREDVAGMVRRHMQFAEVRRMRPATLRRMAARPTFADELELHRLDCAASCRKFDNYCFLLDFLVKLAREPPVPPPLLYGRDLLAMGMAPGPHIGQLLREVETRRLEGEIRTRDEALAWVRRNRSDI